MLEHSKDLWHALPIQRINGTLHKLTRKTHCAARLGHISPAFRKRQSTTTLNQDLEKLWDDWNSLSAQRKILLDRRRVDWKAVDENLIQTNTVLLDCPCPRLARVARLARIPVTNSLRVAGILIYAVIGRFAPYMGQLGGKTRRARTPLRRLMEHAARSKNLQRHFTEQRKRNLRTQGKLGNRPSLPRTLARVGTHSASILPLQYATRQNIDARENLTERILAPTLNRVTPYRGYRHIEWLYRDVQIPEHKSVKQTACEFLSKHSCSYSAPQMLHLLNEC